MKQHYSTPLAEWVLFEKEDILTMSDKYPNEIESGDGYIETPRY